MKQFQMLRYLKNLRYLILLVTLLGSLAIYLYAVGHQEYTAEAIIQYNNPTASQGLAPDGAPINPKEIYSAGVITDVIAELGLDANVDQLRSNCTVTEFLTEDDIKRKEAVLAEGEEYTEFSPIYQITFRADSSKSKGYVRNVLDSIINNYYVFYSKKYIDSAVIPNNVTNVSVENYDYINCVELLEDSVDEISTYLQAKQAVYPTFRSAETGLSFEDLSKRYDYIKQNTITKLYAIVLGDKLTKNKEALIKSYENRYDNSVMERDNLKNHIEKQRDVVEQFGDKVTQEENYVAGAVGDNTDAIIQNVEDYFREELDAETTYDELITHYVSLQSSENTTELERQWSEYVLSVFSGEGIKDDVSSEQVKQVSTKIETLVEEMNQLYHDVESTSQELNEYSGAKNIASLTGTYVEQAVDVKLYLMIAIFLFFVIGCAGAIVLGRLFDFLEYFLYTDKKTGTANRIRCDVMIDEYHKSLLSEQFCCITLKLKRLQNANATGGRNAGDTLLKRFGTILNKVAPDYGFIGYNNGDMFIGLFESCTQEKAEKFVEQIEREIEQTNHNEEELLAFDYGIAVSTEAKIYEIRQLLGESIKRLRESQ